MCNAISVTLHTTVGPQCDVIQINFAFRVGVDLHIHRVHTLVTVIVVGVIMSNFYVLNYVLFSILSLITRTFGLPSRSLDCLLGLYWTGLLCSTVFHF